MRPATGIRVPVGAAHQALPLILAALGLILSGPAAANVQQNDPGPGAAGQSQAEPQTGSAPAADDPLTFLDSVTVSATLRPAPVRETPGMVSVIDSQTIEERLVRDFADLVKFEPGVYIENNVTRLGLNGFNIRGIGGNRVMTQVDGVQTSEQFDFGPFNVHQVGLDVDALKTVEIVRSANSALYGSDALGGVVSLFTKDPADYLDGQGIHLGAKTTWDGRSDAVSGNLALAAGTEKLQGSVFASVHRGNEIFPTKYFPESTVAEAGAYLQAELQFGRLSFVPGVRYDHFALDANQNDPVFIASLNPEAADFSDGAVSPKLGVAANLTDTLTVHAQYSGGFRAPPYSAINTGFTNPRGGYTTLPNPELRAETSRNVEVGVRTAFDRASLGLTVFSNRYDDFIASTSLGLNPLTQLLEFQSQNLDEAEIEGVELRGEAYLSDSVMLRWSYARINGVEIFEDTVVPPLAEETQLGEIAPNEGVLGLRYVRPSGRWGSELSVRMVEGYRHGGEEQFAPDAYQVVDLVGFASLAESLTFRLGLMNLTDNKHFEWWNVRGRPANDPVIDRYTSPGLSVVASLGYDW